MNTLRTGTGSSTGGGRGTLHIAHPAPPTRGARRFIWIFSIAMVLTAGTAFVFKLIEFIHTATLKGSAAMGSFLIPVLNYLLVAAGFALLFLWAYFSGQFRDLEAPKYRMLEMQDQIDRDEAEARRTTAGGHGSTDRKGR